MKKIDASNLLVKNPFSRPGIIIDKIRAIIVHWTASPTATAKNIGKYFNSLALQDHKDNKIDRFASTHFTVDKKEIIQHLPFDEIAYHVGSKNYTDYAKDKFPKKYFSNKPYTPNHCTIGIEVCHPTWLGFFEKETIENLTDLLTYLCFLYDLDPIFEIMRHYDITGKLCPKYYVENPDEWRNIKIITKSKLWRFKNERTIG